MNNKKARAMTGQKQIRIHSNALTQRERRLCRDLQGVMIFDQGGAEPLLSYTDREIMFALHALRKATPKQRRELALRAMLGDGDLSPAPVVELREVKQ